MSNERERYNRLMTQLRMELGPELLAAVMDASVTGIKVGGDGKVLVKRLSNTWEDTQARLDYDTRERILRIIAHELGQTLNAESSQLQGELPLTGSRIEGAVPPTSDYTFVIRRHSSRVFTLPEYVQAGIMTEPQAWLLYNAVQDHKNIVVAGAVDSGKTTLTNALLAEIRSMEHVVIVEDTAELKCNAPNVTFRKTSASVPMRAVLRSVLRLDFDRLIVGETRGAECYEVIKLWDAGRRGGITTIHAEDAHGVIRRIGQFCLEAGVQPQWELIESVVDIIVYIKVTNGVRKMTETVEVAHGKGGKTPIRLQAIHAGETTSATLEGEDNGKKNHARFITNSSTHPARWGDSYDH